MAIGFGVIGCGAVGAWHAISIGNVEGASLIGVADSFIASAQKFGERFNTRVFESVEAMLACAEIDCVCICTPSGLHADLAVAACNAGKHVLVEKPMALTVPDCDRIIAAADANHVKVGVVSQSRLAGCTQVLRKYLSEGKLGQIITADVSMKYYRSQEYYDAGGWRGTWAMDGGGALMNQGIHSVDLLQYLAGPVKSIHAIARTLARKIEVEDTAVAIIEFKSGAVGTLEATTAIHPGYPRRLSISGTEGTITISDENFVDWDIKGEGLPEGVTLGVPEDCGASDPMNFSTAGHEAHITDMVGAITENRDPFISAREGKKPVEIIRAVYESSQTGKTVYFD